MPVPARYQHCKESLEKLVSLLHVQEDDKFWPFPWLVVPTGTTLSPDNWKLNKVGHPGGDDPYYVVLKNPNPPDVIKNTLKMATSIIVAVPAKPQVGKGYSLELIQVKNFRPGTTPTNKEPIGRWEITGLVPKGKIEDLKIDAYLPYFVLGSW
jgi:hypothetical protein